jgi:hypothetical protein
MQITSRILVIGVLFLLKVLFGLWVSRSGRPFNVVVLTIHKLISLAIVALIALAVRQRGRAVGLSGGEIAAAIVTGVLFLVAIISGGLVSTDKPANAVILAVHRFVPYLVGLATAATLYLLARGTV